MILGNNGDINKLYPTSVSHVFWAGNVFEFEVIEGNQNSWKSF